MKIHDEHSVYIAEIVCLVTSFDLMHQGRTAICQRAVAERRLDATLHLHDNMMPVLGDAIYVEYDSFVFGCLRNRFLVLERDIYNLIFRIQYVIQKPDQDIFMFLASECPLERIVGHQVHIACHKTILLLCSIATNLYIIYCNCKLIYSQESTKISIQICG